MKNFDKEKYHKYGEMIAARQSECNTIKVFDIESWRAMSKDGFWRIPVAKQNGGLGYGWTHFAKAVELISTKSNDLGFMLSMIAHMGAMYVLDKYGTNEQRQYYLSRLMNGEVACTAITEPTGGSDVSRVTTSAKKYENKFILNGHKAHITNSPIADIIILVGRISDLEDKKSITLFILDKHQKGISVGQTEDMFGNVTSPTASILIENIPISNKNIIGCPGDGLKVLYEMIALDRVMYGIIASGFIKPIINNSLKYSIERVAFNRPISEFQYVQKKIVDMKISMETIRCVSFDALEKHLNSDQSTSIMCSIAKAITAEKLFKIAEDYMILHGHKGYINGDITRMFRDIAGVGIAGGTTDIQYVNIFNQLRKNYTFSAESRI